MYDNEIRFDVGSSVISDGLFAQIPQQNPGQKHVACVLLVDTSGSMTTRERNGKVRIDELNEGLRAFGEAINNDSYAKGIVDVCVLAFSSDVETILPFQPVSGYRAPILKAGGLTSMNEAIVTGLDFIENRKALYKSMGTPYWRPWLFLLTDGNPTDGKYENAAKQRLGEAIQKGKVVFMPMAIGETASRQRISQYSNGGTVLEADAGNFAEAFTWLSVSLANLGKSDPSSTDIETPPLPQTLRIAIG